MFIVLRMLSAITFLSLAVLPGPCLRSQPHTATFSLHDTQGSKDELPDLEKQVSRVSLYYVRPQRVHEYTIITIGFIAFEAHTLSPSNNVFVTALCITNVLWSVHASRSQIITLYKGDATTTGGGASPESSRQNVMLPSTQAYIPRCFLSVLAKLG